MHFKRYGRTHQLRIETADDLADVLELDESLWMATSAAIGDFRCDAKFLQLIDTDANGRIYTNEVKDAIRWLLDRLADPSRIAEEPDRLPLSAIRADSAGGKALIAAAR